MIPAQRRTVDPFSSYHSDNVNKLTRILTSGRDVIVRDTHLFASIGSTSSLVHISDGYAVKDDLMLEIKDGSESGFSVIDLTDPLNYIASSTNPTSNILDFHAYPATTYVVLAYQYVKTSTPNEASLMILKDINDFTTDKYIFVARAMFSASQVVSIIYQDDSINGIYRSVGNLEDPYTDVDARNADVLNQITNHLPANDVGGYDRGSIVVTGTVADTPPGKIKLIPYSDVSGLKTNIKYTWSGTAIHVTHNRGYFPMVQLIDDGNKEYVAGIVTQNTINDFYIDFDFSSVDPPITTYTFWLVY